MSKFCVIECHLIKGQGLVIFKQFYSTGYWSSNLREINS